MLVNNEDYKLELRPGLLFESKISDRENPFILNVSPEPIVAER